MPTGDDATESTEHDPDPSDDRRLARILRSLYDDRAARIHPLLLEPGHTMPKRRRLVGYDLDREDQRAAVTERHQCTVTVSSSGSRNVLFVDEALTAPRTTIHFGGSSAICVLGQNAAARGRIGLADESVVVLAGQKHGRVLAVNIELRDRRERLFWGSGASSEGVSMSVRGDDLAVVVGDDCMFSWGIWIRPSDMHMIIDPVAGTLLNPPTDVLVGPHVWVGQSALIMKGADIGAGSIIGAHGVVGSGHHDAMSIHAGVPVRKVRSDVTWDRLHTFDEAAVERARAVYETYRPTPSPSTAVEPARRRRSVMRRLARRQRSA